MNPSQRTSRQGPPIVLAVLLLAAAAAACGKKGPPLPPLSTLPRAPESVTARLQGDQVQIRFRIPRATQSNIEPADLERVDVYALTTDDEVQRDDFLERATVVASVPVRRPAPEGEEDRPRPPGEEEALAQGELAVVFETLTPDAYTRVVLDEDEDKPQRRQRRRDGGPIVVKRTPLTPPDLGVPLEKAPVRYYAAVGVTRGGKKGAPSALVSVTLEPPPPAAMAPEAEVRENAAVALTWDPPPGLRQPVQRTTLAPPARARPGATRTGAPGSRATTEPEDLDLFDGDDEEEPDVDVSGEDDEPTEIAPRDSGASGAATPSEPKADAQSGDEDDAADGETAEGAAAAPDGTGGAETFLPARPLMPWASVTSGYHVYVLRAQPDENEDGKEGTEKEEGEGQEENERTRPSPYSVEALPELLTQRPVTKPEFVDSTAQFGDERCYVIRVAEMVGTTVREGPPSQPTCVEVKDVFPPAAPKSLEAVAAGGAVNLIWEPNRDADLAGYLVIRSEGDESTARQLTPKPIRETTYRDTEVRPGRRYVYVVVAVDGASPPNRSGPSNAVEATAR
ncbi:MAG TPA: hypothetical protein VNK41_05175 [Vicinamibacterales bacterium]|nr:hypothetical protein [Vicinamibacterales bacterium]